MIEKITFDSKHARKWGEPFARVDHDECQLWFRSENVSSKQRYLPPTCEKCTSLRGYLQTEIKRRSLVSSDQKAKHILPSSHTALKHLTPTSKAKRLKLVTEERRAMKKKIDKYLQYDVSVAESTHDELLQIVSQIQHRSKQELETVLAEADKAGKGDLLRMKWKQDVEERVAFERDQQTNSKLCNS